MIAIRTAQLTLLAPLAQELFLRLGADTVVDPEFFRKGTPDQLDWGGWRGWGDNILFDEIFQKL